MNLVTNLFHDAATEQLVSAMCPRDDRCLPSQAVPVTTVLRNLTAGCVVLGREVERKGPS